jgi:CRISPR/Cas system-associated exonuclease Cas4 (RecB family)
MKINHLSVSRKQLWDQCQQAYKYKYHLEVESQEVEPEYFAYGKLVHKVAEDYVKNKGEIEINEILKKYISGELLLENKKVELSTEYKNKLKEHISNIKKLSDRVGFEGETEYAFNFDLDYPNKKTLSGVIDRLIIKEDKCFIIDYKTTKRGKWRKTENTIRQDVQMLSYAMVAEKEFNIKPENIRAALFYLDGGNLIPVKFNRHMIDKTKELLLSTYDLIKNKNPEEVWGKTGEHCRRCAFRKICPFWSLT